MGKAPVNLSKRFPPAGVPLQILSALLLYIALSVYLLRPYFDKISGYYFLYVINPVIAAWGTYFLSRRWMNNWTPSLLAGAIYGFSPFALSFASFQQPVAGFSFVIVPWLFLPSVYWHKNKPADAFRFFVRTVFSLLPFAGICLLFWAAAQKWAGPHFLMPKNLQLTPKHFCDLVFPLYQSGDYLTFGIYHVPLVLSIMGVFVLVSIQRISVVFPIAAAMTLCFLNPILQVSPIVWAAIPVLFLAILAGLGFQSILLAGKADSKWIIACAIVASIAAAFFGGLVIRRFTGLVFEWTALMYAVAAAGLWILFFFAKTGLRWPWMRWILLTAATAIDLIFSARYLVDKLF
ncbi:MAG: hypothetical protein ISS71_02070 [Phycisphaerae bacterium]|nr:hypothetical protein [Phycisphaerae bacterium]